MLLLFAILLSHLFYRTFYVNSEILLDEQRMSEERHRADTRRIHALSWGKAYLQRKIYFVIPFR